MYIFFKNEQIVRAPSETMRLASNVNVAIIAPRNTRGQKLIRRQFRGETKPSKHRFKLFEPDQTYLFASETKRMHLKCHAEQ